jgi:hypothetical protein
MRNLLHGMGCNPDKVSGQAVDGCEKPRSERSSWVAVDLFMSCHAS